MKNFLFLIFFTLFLTYSIQGQEFNGLDKSPMDIIEFPAEGINKSLRVLYSRPQLRGRDINKLVPNGKLWRTGANESTEVTFYKPMNFGGKLITSGSYSLYTIPGAKEWTVIINSSTHTWGTYSYNESNDLMRITVPVIKSKKLLEALSMTFENIDNGAKLHIGWHDLRVAIPFTN